MSTQIGTNIFLFLTQIGTNIFLFLTQIGTNMFYVFPTSFRQFKGTNLAQMKLEFPVCKSKFQSSEICKIKCQKGREETEVSITNLAVKFARLETSLANRLK